VANAKLAYRRYRELVSGERWDALAARGASAQRCLWASTWTKDPAHRDVRYVEGLIGPETITTMPQPTLRAFQDNGRVEPTLERGLGDAERLLERLADVGLDYDAVTATLEREESRRLRPRSGRCSIALRAQRGPARAKDRRDSSHRRTASGACMRSQRPRRRYGEGALQQSETAAPSSVEGTGSRREFDQPPATAWSATPGPGERLLSDGRAR